MDCVAAGRGCDRHILNITPVEHISQKKLKEVLVAAEKV